MIAPPKEAISYMKKDAISSKYRVDKNCPEEIRNKLLDFQEKFRQKLKDSIKDDERFYANADWSGMDEEKKDYEENLKNRKKIISEKDFLLVFE